MKTTRLFGRDIYFGNSSTLLAYLDNAIRKGRQTVFFCNVHMLMLSREDPRLAEAMKSADLVFPDGMPVAWLQRRLGIPGADVLRGYEAVDFVCEQSAQGGNPIGFFGTTEYVLTELVRNLETRFPGLKIDYVHEPGVISEDPKFDPKQADQINAKNLHALFVGLGCPKQEKWVAEYAPHLNCSVLAVGAAFDWLAGTTRKPPKWMEKAGLAWFFRLMENPAKMWRRYMIYNTKYVLASLKLLTWEKWTSHD